LRIEAAPALARKHTFNGVFSAERSCLSALWDQSRGMSPARSLPLFVSGACRVRSAAQAAKPAKKRIGRRFFTWISAFPGVLCGLSESCRQAGRPGVRLPLNALEQRHGVSRPLNKYTFEVKR